MFKVFSLNDIIIHVFFSSFFCSILYHTVEVRNRFKGLDLIECLMNYGMKFVTLYWRRDQDHPHGKEMQKSKMAVWGGLTNSCEKKRSEKQRRKEKI